MRTETIKAPLEACQSLRGRLILFHASFDRGMRPYYHNRGVRGNSNLHRFLPESSIFPILEMNPARPVNNGNSSDQAQPAMNSPYMAGT
jgi:hypothetical protein